MLKTSLDDRQRFQEFGKPRFQLGSIHEEHVFSRGFSLGPLPGLDVTREASLF